MGCVNVFLPAIYTWTGFWTKALAFNSQAEGQNFLRQTILDDYNNKSYKRQVKETVPTWSQNWLPPCNRKRRWCWERLKAGGEGDDRGWASWMASPTQWNDFEQAPEVGDGQGSLACCSPWGHKESDTTEWLNCNRFIMQIHNAQRGHRRPKNRREFLSFKFSCHKIWILFHRMNLLPSSSRLLAAHSYLQLWDWGIHFQLEAWLCFQSLPTFLFRTSSCSLVCFECFLPSFSLQPEKVICSRDRLGVCFLWLPW